MKNALNSIHTYDAIAAAAAADAAAATFLDDDAATTARAAAAKAHAAAAVAAAYANAAKAQPTTYEKTVAKDRAAISPPVAAKDRAATSAPVAAKAHAAASVAAANAYDATTTKVHAAADVSNADDDVVAAARAAAAKAHAAAAFAVVGAASASANANANAARADVAYVNAAVAYTATRAAYTAAVHADIGQKAKGTARLSKEPVKQTSARPNPLAEKVLYLFLPKKHREHLPGDLEEEFHSIMLPRFGLSYAKRWYWLQVVRSIVASNKWVARFIAYGGGLAGLYQVAKGLFQAFGWIEYDEEEPGHEEKRRHR